MVFLDLRIPSEGFFVCVSQSGWSNKKQKTSPKGPTAQVLWNGF